MFVDRCKEDRLLAAGRPGLVDRALHWCAAAWAGRRRAAARLRLVRPGRNLTCRLGAGKTLALHGQRCCLVRCRRGAVWVTLEGEGRDRVLTPGRQVFFDRGGKVVIAGRGELAEIEVRWD